MAFLSVFDCTQQSPKHTKSASSVPGSKKHSRSSRAASSNSGSGFRSSRSRYTTNNDPYFHGQSWDGNACLHPYIRWTKIARYRYTSPRVRVPHPHLYRNSIHLQRVDNPRLREVIGPYADGRAWQPYPGSPPICISDTLAYRHFQLSITTS